MKKTVFTLILLLGYCISNSQTNKLLDTNSCPFKLGEKKAITEVEDNFTRAKISPDGTKVLVTKKGYTGIYILDLENNNSITTLTNEAKVGFNARWTEDGQTILFESNNYDRPNKPLMYDIKEKKFYTDDNNLKSAKYGGIKKNEISVKYNFEREIVEATDGTTTWDVTKRKGMYYNLVISPDKDKVLIHKNDGNMYVYKIDGSGMFYKLGKGISQSWTPDSKYLVYFVDLDKGQHSIVESDIYLCSVDGKRIWKLTNTKDEIELFPFLSANGSKMSYYDQNTNRIYVTDFIKR